MQARGVSLWLTPEGPEAQAVGALVSELSCRFGTPVVRSARDADGRARAASGGGRSAAAASWRAGCTRSRCASWACSAAPTIFRALYVLASPDLPILDARQRAESLFPAHPRESFMPHLSLLYGALPAETMRLLAEEVASSSPPSLSLRTLEVVATEGPVSAWRSLARLPLGAA